MRAALRIGYLAEGFSGFSPQPGRTTVGGLIETGLRSHRALTTGTTLRVASRTDRGVSALGNVLSIDSPLAGPSLGRLLNALDPRLFCFGYAEVDPQFDPRFALSRTYRYFLPAAGHDAAKLGRIAKLFVGEHEFASFSRRDAQPRATRRPLSHLEVLGEPDYLRLELEAPAFLWGQVRKIVAALLLCERGRLGVEQVRAALEGERALTLPMAPAENLVLWDVAYDFAFTPLRGVADRRARPLEVSLAEVALRAKLLGLFREAVIAGPPRLSAESG